MRAIDGNHRRTHHRPRWTARGNQPRVTARCTYGVYHTGVYQRSKPSTYGWVDGVTYVPGGNGRWRLEPSNEGQGVASSDDSIQQVISDLSCYGGYEL